MCLYSVPEWDENKKTYNFVVSKFGDTFERIIHFFFDNCRLILKYLSNKNIFKRKHKRVALGIYGLNCYAFNSKNAGNTNVLYLADFDLSFLGNSASVN